MKVNEREMGYLSKSECVQLLDALAENPDERLAVEILLSTGARWGEVAALEQRRVLHCRITFSKTKNSKNRTVPISESLFEKDQKTGRNWCFRRWIIHWFAMSSKRSHLMFLTAGLFMRCATPSPVIS